ncbi:MAG: stage 0 sporulation family protein [Firmicutes bacterium]|nr:stage 0 sporulation family protein [Bacillota bacterium]
MVKVVGVRFKHAGKIYYFDPADIELAAGDPVIVETVRGIEYGQVVVAPKEVDESDVVQPLKQVLRRATAEDMVILAENAEKERSAFQIGLEKIEKHGLPMKLVDVEYTFDNSKVIFYFTADGRVDFRELVKDLASVFRTRIELRQIGVRDQAKMLGGLGPCGRPLCCATFLGDFEPVSIKMAKEQNLSLNPSKISGICGRLMCCLKFEADVYKAEKEETLPETAAEGREELLMEEVCACGECAGCMLVDAAVEESDVLDEAAKELVVEEVEAQVEEGGNQDEDDFEGAPLQENEQVEPVEPAVSTGEGSRPDSAPSSRSKSKRRRKRRYRRPRQRAKQEEGKQSRSNGKK